MNKSNRIEGDVYSDQQTGAKHPFAGRIYIFSALLTFSNPSQNSSIGSIWS